MTSKLKLLVATSTVSTVMLGASPAYAVGTDAGTSITNNVSVSFDVGGTPQTAETDSDTFVVDRRVDLLVQETGNGNTIVAPGATQQAVTYDITNESNDTIDVLLTAEEVAGNDFALASAITFYLDDGDGIFNAADTLITSVDDLAEDDTVTVHAVADIPAAVVTGDTADVTLIGQAADSTTGVAFTNDFGNADDPTVVQNVFADDDGPGTTDVAGPGGFGDGRHSATDTYEVAAADISVFKSSVVISDPVNGTVNPKSIPGAVIEYCISVANAAGSATATNVAISDTLPADTPAGGVTFVAGSILVDGAVASPGASQVCTGGVAGGSFADPVVSGTLSDIAAGTAGALIFRVTVD